MRDVGPVTGGITFRNVDGYYFRSDVNRGVIPIFGTLDANVALRVSQLPRTLVTVGVSNLFSCTGTKVKYVSTAVPPNSQILSQDRGCGLNRRDVEMINMPEIGTMVLIGLRFER